MIYIFIDLIFKDPGTSHCSTVIPSESRLNCMANYDWSQKSPDCWSYIMPSKECEWSSVLSEVFLSQKP